MSNPPRAPQFEAPRYQFYTPANFSPSSFNPPSMPSSYQPNFNPPSPYVPLTGRATPVIPSPPPSFLPPSNSFNTTPPFVAAPIVPPVRTFSHSQNSSIPTPQLPASLTTPHNFIPSLPTPPNISTHSFQPTFSSAPSLPKHFATSFPISPAMAAPSIDPASLRFAGASALPPMPPPTLSGRAHFMNPLPPSMECPPTFFDKAIVSAPSFSSSLPAPSYTLQSNINVQQSYRRQIEQNMQMFYLVAAPPERPFPSMPFMTFQIGLNTTLFVAPSVMNDLIQNTTSAQRWALQTQLSEIISRVNPSSQFSQAAVIIAPTADLSKPKAPKSKTRGIFSSLGVGLNWALADAVHGVWTVMGPMKEEMSRYRKFIDDKLGFPSEPQASEITKNGHKQIDEFFHTSLAFRHDPEYQPRVLHIGLPPPTQIGALVGRITRLGAQANAARAGSIASEVIRDISAVERAGVVSRDLSAVKNVSVLKTPSSSAVQVVQRYSDPRFAIQLQKQLESHGSKSIVKSHRSIKQILEVHANKLPSLEFKSSVEREINTFKKQLETLEKFASENNIFLE